MIFLPVVERELRVAAKRWTSFGLRTLAAGLFVLMGFFALSAAALTSSAVSGRDLFRSLAEICWWCCLAAGPVLVTDTLAAERRQNTLGLLFLTDLRPLSIVLGKASAALVRTLSVVLASLPVFTLAVILGGVTGVELLAVSAALVTTLLFSVGVTLAVSAGCRDSRSAFALGAFLVVVFGLLLPQTSSTVALASPGQLMELAYATGIGWGPNDFLISLLLVHGLTWLGFSLAALLLKTFAHEPIRMRKASFRRAAFKTGQAAPDARRSSRRRRLLNANPWAWFAGRNVLKRRLIAAVFVPLLPLWMRFGWPNDVALTLQAVWFIQILLKMLVVSESSHHFMTARREGTFELLFTTPLSPEQIIRGQRRAVRRLFALPILATAGFANLLVMPQFAGWDRLIPPLFTLVYLSDFSTATLLGLWRGLAAKRSYLVVPGVVARIGIWPSLLFLLMSPALAAAEQWWPTLGVFALIFGISNGIQHSYARDMLNSDLRAKLAEQFISDRRIRD